MLEDFFDQYASRYGYAKPGHAWCYEDGCVYCGLEELGNATGNAAWRDHLERLIAVQVDADGALSGYMRDEYNIDNIMAGRALFVLTETRRDRFGKALDRLADQLAHHPRTATGNYWHKSIYPHQVWLDGLYMGLPFQIEYGLLRDRPDLVDDAAGQLLGAMSIMRDATTGLYFHGYDESRAEAWADAETGLSQSFWGRANGWLAMALVDSYALLPKDHPARAEIGKRILALAEAILGQRTQNGLWLQVMNRPDLEGNYEETSSSAMFAYFLFRTARLIAAGASLADKAVTALEALSRRYVRHPDGIWQLDNVCEVAGLGGFLGRQRDGTPGYYVSEPVVANDPKGVGSLMMAAAEQLRADAVARPALAARASLGG